MLERVYKGFAEYPGGGKSTFTALVFRDGDALNIQRLKISNCAKACSSNKRRLRNEAAYQVVRAARNAAREMRKEFDPELLDKELVQQAIEMLMKDANA